MSFITGRHIPRRTFLRGVGASIGLPVLDAMIPAGRAARAAAAGDLTRLICIEEVHGVAGSTAWGMSQYLFAPETVGRDFELARANVLSSLEPFRDYLTIVSNTDCRMAEPFEAPEVGGDHSRSTAVFLTQAHPKMTGGADLYVGPSMDQLYAQRFGQDTPLPSLQLCIESPRAAGGGDYHSAYGDSISWASPSEPLPMVRNPRVVFDLLFGAGDTPADRVARRKINGSILDWVASEVAYLTKTLDPVDRRALDQYLEDVREIERRIQMVEARNSDGREREMPEAPAGVPDSFEEHMRLMFDLQVLAFQTDMTRVVAFKTGRDVQERAHPESGTERAFHAASHHGNNHEAILEFNMISSYRLSMLSYFLRKLKATTEGNTHLLDKTAILWGSPMGDANAHNHRQCPLILLGHANGQLGGNLHLQAPVGTPMANVMLSLLQRLGHDDLNSFGDSTGGFDLTSGPSGPTVIDPVKG
jgi:hypothetical protein